MKTNKAGKDSLNTNGINTLHMFPLVISEMRLVKTVQSLPSLLPMKKTKTYHNFDDCTHINKAHEYIRC